MSSSGRPPFCCCQEGGPPPGAPARIIVEQPAFRSVVLRVHDVSDADAGVDVLRSLIDSILGAQEQTCTAPRHLFLDLTAVQRGSTRLFDLFDDLAAYVRAGDDLEWILELAPETTLARAATSCPFRNLPVALSVPNK